MKRTISILAALLIVATLTLKAFYGNEESGKAAVTAEAVTRGSIVSTVAATGTLEAVTTVQVGSQVSGMIQVLSADFNSLVKKGQVLARLDQSLYLSALEQAQANLVRAEADAERARVTLADAATKLARAKELANRQLIPMNELDTADVNQKNAAAQVRSAQAGVGQARASVDQARVNLAKTVIASPIDGIVVSRNVDVGQTVAASMSAPVLYLIAADLTQMQLNASIDESDLGRVAEGQAVAFTVDAYPGDTFKGVVQQVRLSPLVQSNVVTYAAIINAPNPQLKLMPGMTASITIEAERRDDVLRIPAAAARFKPTADMLAALDVPSGSRPAGSVVWVSDGKTISLVPVKTGLSDGTWTEVVDAPFTEGTRLVTRVVLGDTDAQPSRSTSTNNPLMGTQPRAR
jgi:HlyD family secretion protein